MNIELRSVPGCPNLPPARDLLRACLAELGLPLSVAEVVGEYPSPSVLVDGMDVMGIPVGAVSSCRLDVPTADAIRAALRRAIDASDGSACCEGGPIRVDRPLRAADLPADLREVYRSVLRNFATTGTAPALTDLDVPVGIEPADALARLAGMDLLAMDEGRLAAAYPFSPTPTDHVVRLGAVSVHAMCAVDALGMSAMLGQDTVITSVDPHTGHPIQVTMTGTEAAFTPADAVVVYAASGATGRSVDTCCTTINFFTSQTSAHAWITGHPHLTATILDQRSAVALGRDIFGPLLS